MSCYYISKPHLSDYITQLSPRLMNTDQVQDFGRNLANLNI